MHLFGLFAKHPVAGTVKTRLAEALGPTAAAELSEAFVRDLCDRFAAIADRRWLGITPSTTAACDWFRTLSADRYELWVQPDGDLGVRMEAFFASAFAAGATRAVLIGSDSPTLPLEFIEEAFDSLHAHDVVLGPARDGGYYLIGAARPLSGVLADVRWSSPHTFADTVAGMNRIALRVATLSEWYDVDTVDDLGFLEGHLGALRRLDPRLPESATERWLQKSHWRPI